MLLVIIVWEGERTLPHLPLTVSSGEECKEVRGPRERESKRERVMRSDGQSEEYLLYTHTSCHLRGGGKTLESFMFTCANTTLCHKLAHNHKHSSGRKEVMSVERLPPIATPASQMNKKECLFILTGGSHLVESQNPKLFFFHSSWSCDPNKSAFI